MTDLETTMRVGTDLLLEPSWDELARDAGTVFHLGRFLLAWWDDAAGNAAAAGLFTVRVTEDGTPIGQCAFVRHDDVLRFAGGTDVVDYLGPVAAAGREQVVADAIASFACDQMDWRESTLSGLVGGDDLTRALVTELTRRCPGATVDVGEQSPRLRGAANGYLAGLSGRHRKEVVRKRKRLEEAVGHVRLVSSAATTWPVALDRLLGWKAQATPAAHTFVERYADFVRRLFVELAPAGVAQVVELVAGTTPLASAIVFTHRRTRYLYNMSYDPAVASAFPVSVAPGVVLVSYLAEQALEDGWEFDFLRGTQGYKLQLGGVPEDLVTISLRR
jgi:CelD/BcsL family acetyltransferase involved in cellulose biosynthesis